jgi:signal transduction histidine kinase
VRLDLALQKQPMRLADFLLANLQPILQKWEDFAETILPDARLSSKELRDHAEQMLQEIAADMKTSQSKEEQALKSAGLGPRSEADTAAETHADTRLVSGFSMDQMISEYRALRASVLLLWSQEIKTGIEFELEDMTRFHESIDQMLAESVARYSQSVTQANNLFLGILAHDLRTPLSAIGVGAEIMLRAEQLDSRYIKISSRIFGSAKRAGKIVENLLDFTRSHSSAGLSLKPEKANLKSVCEGIVEEVGIHHPDRTIIFESEGKFEGTFDATRIEQVLCNLIENAALHGAKDSPITVKLRSENDVAIVTVHNDGEPIDPRDLPHIFDPMARYSQHAADERGPSSGLGLGLYIANQIVSAHNGKIEVGSNEVQGTTFSVKLPLKPD